MTLTIRDLNSHGATGYVLHQPVNTVAETACSTTPSNSVSEEWFQSSEKTMLIVLITGNVMIHLINIT